MDITQELEVSGDDPQVSATQGVPQEVADAIETDVAVNEPLDGEQQVNAGSDVDKAGGEGSIGEGEAEAADPSSQAQPEQEGEGATLEDSSAAKDDDATVLRKQINELAAKLAAKDSQGASPQQQPAKSDSTQQQEESTPIAFVSDEEFEKVFSDSSEFNKVLTRLFSSAVQEAVRAVPQIAAAQVDWRIYTVSERERFFSSNHDLLPYAEYIGQIVNALSAQDPAKPFHELLAAAEPIAREQLRLPKAAMLASLVRDGGEVPVSQSVAGQLPQRTEIRPRHPALPQSGGSRKPQQGSKVVSIADELDAMRDL